MEAIDTRIRAVQHPSYDLLLDRYTSAIRRAHSGEGTTEEVDEAKRRLDSFVAKMKGEAEAPAEEPVVIRGYLPRLTPYQKAVVAVHGAKALSGVNTSQNGGRFGHGKAGMWGDQPFGESWHKVKGQRSSSLVNKNRRGHRRWLKKLDQRCLENPSSTFKVNLNKECLESPTCRTEGRGMRKRGRTMEDVVVQLQLLGVEVAL